MRNQQFLIFLVLITTKCRFVHTPNHLRQWIANFTMLSAECFKTLQSCRRNSWIDFTWLKAHRASEHASLSTQAGVAKLATCLAFVQLDGCGDYTWSNKSNNRYCHNRKTLQQQQLKVHYSSFDFERRRTESSSEISTSNVSHARIGG